jgi:hypothetical protein
MSTNCYSTQLILIARAGCVIPSSLATCGGQ